MVRTRGEANEIELTPHRGEIERLGPRTITVATGNFEAVNSISGAHLRVRRDASPVVGVRACEWANETSKSVNHPRAPFFSLPCVSPCLVTGEDRDFNFDFGFGFGFGCGRGRWCEPEPVLPPLPTALGVRAGRVGGDIVGAFGAPLHPLSQALQLQGSDHK